MAVLFHGLLFAVPAEAESLRFALVAKRNDQHHCMLSGKGCAEAAQAQGDTCLFLGAPDRRISGARTRPWSRPSPAIWTASPWR
ncbi:hypothetical protein ACFSVK_16620 [Azorhizophilus paspali]|uniref:hypothetical protein n=1 Tax=Azorhizophilus paspali TaxID=69963 RepID=UPI00363625B0